MVEKKHRDSNLELYRILVMLLIVAHHYVVNSGVMSEINNVAMSSRTVYFSLFGMWGKIGINCFVLITGYYMCTSKITLYKFLKLFLEVVFYNVLITAVFMITGYEQFSVIRSIRMFWPVWSLSSDFTPCFLLFYLTIPFWNILIKGMTQRQHQYLVFLLLFIYSLMASLPMTSVNYNYISWFGVIYVVASYVRLYSPQWMRPLCSWGGIILFLLLAMLSVVCLMWLSDYTGNNLWIYAFVADSNKILALLAALSLFGFFLKLKVPYSRILNVIASSAFGVLCIHANSETMRQWLWKDTLDVISQFHSDYYILLSLLSVFGIYIVCTVLDQIRIELIERPFFRLVNLL